MRTLRGPALLAAALVAASGCSFVTVRRPPPPPVAPDLPVECTRSRAAPVLDTVGAVVVPIVGLFTWALCSYTSAMQGWASDPVSMHCDRVLWATLVPTAAYTGSAVYGFQGTGACRRLVERRGAAAPESPSPP